MLSAWLLPPSVWSSVPPLALYSTGMSLSAPSITIVLMDQFPHLRGTVSSMQGFTQTMFSSLIAGVIAPLVWGSTLSLALTMSGLLLTGFLLRSAYRRPATAPLRRALRDLSWWMAAMLLPLRR